MVVVHTGLSRLVAGLIGRQETSEDAGGKTVGFGVDAVCDLRVGSSRSCDALWGSRLVSVAVAVAVAVAVVVWNVGVDGHSIDDAAWATVGGGLWTRLVESYSEQDGGACDVVDSGGGVWSNGVGVVL